VAAAAPHVRIDDQDVLAALHLRLERLLARPRGAVVGFDAPDDARHLLLQRPPRLADLLHELLHVRVLGPEGARQPRALRLQVRQRGLQLLDEAVVEHLREMLEVLVLDHAVERFRLDPLGARLRQLAVDIDEPVDHDVLALVERDDPVALPELVQRLLGALELRLQLGVLAIEKLARLLGQLEARFQNHADEGGGVRVGEPLGQHGIGGAEADLDQPGVLELLDLEEAEVAADRVRARLDGVAAPGAALRSRPQVRAHGAEQIDDVAGQGPSFEKGHDPFIDRRGNVVERDHPLDSRRPDHVRVMAPQVDADEQVARKERDEALSSFRFGNEQLGEKDLDLLELQMLLRLLFAVRLGVDHVPVSSRSRREARAGGHAAGFCKGGARGDEAGESLGFSRRWARRPRRKQNL
jgi:hypothetical protein